jgi:hypothetical protein
MNSSGTQFASTSLISDPILFEGNVLTESPLTAYPVSRQVRNTKKDILVVLKIRF